MKSSDLAGLWGAATALSFLNTIIALIWSAFLVGVGVLPLAAHFGYPLPFFATWLSFMALRMLLKATASPHWSSNNKGS